MISILKTLHFLYLYLFKQKYMKKNILIASIGLSCLVLVGCGSKVKPSQTIDTWTLFSWEQALTGVQSGEVLGDQNNNTREELTGYITQTQPSTTGTASGSQNVSQDITKLIEARAGKPVDTKKLTEDDVDLIDKVIQKIETMAK